MGLTLGFSTGHDSLALQGAIACGQYGPLTDAAVVFAVNHNPIMDHAEFMRPGRVREERSIVAWPPFRVQHRHFSQATIIGCLLQPRECLDAQLFMDAIGQFWANARNGVQDALGSSLATEVLK